MHFIEAERQHANTLMLDITRRLEQSEIALNENQQEMIARLATLHGCIRTKYLGQISYQNDQCVGSLPHF